MKIGSYTPSPAIPTLGTGQARGAGASDELSRIEDRGGGVNEEHRTPNSEVRTLDVERSTFPYQY
jgi:hypothetical protein